MKFQQLHSLRTKPQSLFQQKSFKVVSKRSLNFRVSSVQPSFQKHHHTPSHIKTPLSPLKTLSNISSATLSHYPTFHSLYSPSICKKYRFLNLQTRKMAETSQKVDVVAGLQSVLEQIEKKRRKRKILLRILDQQQYQKPNLTLQFQSATILEASVTLERTMSMNLQRNLKSCPLISNGISSDTSNLTRPNKSVKFPIFSCQNPFTP